MARSRRKTPIIGVTSASSDRIGKRTANRKLRHMVKLNLFRHSDLRLRDVSDPWDFEKDGKKRVDDPRFNTPEETNEALRK